MTTTRIKSKSKQLSNYSLSVNPNVMSGDAVHEVKRRILDSFACAIGAYDSKASKILIESTKDITGKLNAPVFGEGTNVFYEEAGFVNGSLIRYLDFNDTYLSLEPAHPSDNIGPLIASAQAYGKSPMDLILAIALAYEVQCRLCDGASLRAKGIDHVTYGAFSTACAAGLLMDLSKAELNNALGIAGVCNIATRQTRVEDMSMWKASAFANAARQGLFACRLAKNGLTGPGPIFEGKRGFETLISGPIDLKLPNLGEPPRMIVDTYIKPYPVEYHAQTAVDAAVSLHAEGIKLDDVNEIVIYTHGASYQIIGSEPEKWKPTSKETADHSLPYCAAVALRDGNVTDESFHEKNYKDQTLIDFLQKIKVVEDENYTKDYPNSFGNKLEVKLNDGKVVTKEVLHPLGHPKNKMSDERLFEKWRELASPHMAKDQIEATIEKVMNLQKASDLTDLVPKF